jgi:hypothetical protein
MEHARLTVEEFRTLFGQLSARKHPARLEIFEELSEQARAAAGELFDAFPELSRVILYPTFATREGHLLVFSDWSDQIRQQLIALGIDYPRLETETNRRVVAIAQHLVVKINRIVTP